MKNSQKSRSTRTNKVGGITPAEAAKELLRRRRARRSLIDFTKAVDIPGKPVSEKEGDLDWVFHPVETDVAAHHLLMLDVFEKVVTGVYPRAMFFLPPGSAKSCYGSAVAPAWAMGKFAGTKIILTSYGSDLARRHGRKARAIVRSPRFTSVFNTSISSETSAADEWALDNGSEYLAGGILSGITGNRAHGLIIDDPIRGREQADSEVIREKTWSAYQEDLRTRLIPGGWEFIIQTRWHMDDLAGRILPKDYNGESGLIHCRDGREWYVVCLPMVCERTDDPLGRKVGDRLWPEWFTEAHVEGFKSQPRTWAALFQQRPVAEDGGILKLGWFKRYREAPAEFRRIILSADTAHKEREINDPSAVGVWGETYEKRLYLLDMWVQRANYPTLKRAIRLLYEKWSPAAVLIEDKGSGTSLIQDYRNPDAGEDPLPVIAIPVNAGQSKVLRANDSAPMIESGLVYLPESAPWLADLESEVMQFPVAAHDDQVDQMTQLLNWLRPKGAPMFDKQLANMAALLKPAPLRYRCNAVNGQWLAADDGELQAWAEPGNGAAYVMGCMFQQTPVAASHITVIERMTGRQVALFRQQSINLETFAVLIAWVGHRYNTAWAVVHNEVEGETLIKHLLKRYRRVYAETSATAAKTGAMSRNRTYGFSALRRIGPLVEQLAVEVRQGVHQIADRDTIMELQGFRKEATGEVFVDLGCPSERVLTRAMAGFVRQQLPAVTLQTNVKQAIPPATGWGGRV